MGWSWLDLLYQCTLYIINVLKVSNPLASHGHRPLRPEQESQQMSAVLDLGKLGWVKS